MCVRGTTPTGRWTRRRHGSTVRLSRRRRGCVSRLAVRRPGRVGHESTRAGFHVSGARTTGEPPPEAVCPHVGVLPAPTGNGVQDELVPRLSDRGDHGGDATGGRHGLTTQTRPRSDY